MIELGKIPKLMRNKQVDAFLRRVQQHHLPFRYILWSIALLGELIVDETKLAALLSWGDAVQTDEELGAVVSVSILGVRVVLAKLISGRSLRALEPIRSFQSCNNLQ